jgi:hypothetical protein
MLCNKKMLLNEKVDASLIQRKLTSAIKDFSSFVYDILINGTSSHIRLI